MSKNLDKKRAFKGSFLKSEWIGDKDGDREGDIFYSTQKV